MGRIRIVSDGTDYDTKIIDEETGCELTNVIAVNWTLKKNRIVAEATLILENVPIEVIGETGGDHESGKRI